MPGPWVIRAWGYYKDFLSCEYALFLWLMLTHNRPKGTPRQTLLQLISLIYGKYLRSTACLPGSSSGLRPERRQNILVFCTPLRPVTVYRFCCWFYITWGINNTCRLYLRPWNMIKSKFGVGVLSKIKLTGIKAESYKLQNTSWKRWTDVINAFSSWSKTLDCLSVHDPSKVIAWLYVWPCLSAFVFYGFCCCRFICLFVPCHLFLIFSSPIYPVCIDEFFGLFLCLLVRACVRACNTTPLKFALFTKIKWDIGVLSTACHPVSASLHQDFVHVCTHELLIPCAWWKTDSKWTLWVMDRPISSPTESLKASAWTKKN